MSKQKVLDTPYWRWLRACARQESMALRAYARNGMLPPPYVPIPTLDEFDPRVNIANIIIGPDTPAWHFKRKKEAA